ncbi:MAG TPA: AlpA family phage regulatory protein [Polyangia bacterium]|nr:AlpA family phage regulatory protein [Polyangia bacterium]
MRVLRRSEVVAMVGLSISTIRRLEERGAFPKRIKLSRQAVGYLQDQVVEWIVNREVVAHHQATGNS